MGYNQLAVRARSAQHSGNKLLELRPGNQHRNRQQAADDDAQKRTAVKRTAGVHALPWSEIGFYGLVEHDEVNQDRYKDAGEEYG